MNRLRLTSLVFIALLAACGGSVAENPNESLGGSAGAGGSAKGGASTGGASTGGSAIGGSSTGGAGGVVDACQVAAPGAGPWETLFLFRNNSSKSVYLYENCSIQFDIKACSEAYASAVPISASCSIECAEAADGGGCIACGACPSNMVEVKPGEAYDLSWAGFRYTFDMVDGCTCHNTLVAAAGIYRVSVSVWNAPFDPWSPTQPTQTIVQDFRHGLDKTVTVHIGL